MVTVCTEPLIRAGLVREFFRATFPSGEGSDLAGVVEEVGARDAEIASPRPDGLLRAG